MRASCGRPHSVSDLAGGDGCQRRCRVGGRRTGRVVQLEAHVATPDSQVSAITRRPQRRLSRPDDRRQRARPGRRRSDEGDATEPVSRPAPPVTLIASAGDMIVGSDAVASRTAQPEVRQIELGPMCGEFLPVGCGWL